MRPLLFLSELTIDRHTIIMNTCIHESFDRSVCACLHDTCKLLHVSAFCLVAAYSVGKSRTSSHVQKTGQGEGHFSENSRSLIDVMNRSVICSEIASLVALFPIILFTV